jgi:ubiquinone/menaquinone biosynthesis C-methylase UbiE
MADSTASIATAYDAIAPQYDRLLTGDGWMRAVLWRHYARAFTPGQHVLDLGCGTGLDSLFLARNGVRVTAIDASPGMLAELRAKSDRERLAGLIDIRVQDLAQLGTFPSRCAEGMISGFAALNTLAEPARFAAEARRVLRPGGRLVAHLLAPPGVWDRLRSPGGSRALWERGERIIHVCGQPIRHLQVPARELYRRFFVADFQLRRAYALGFLLPYRLMNRLPGGMAQWLGRWEARLGTRPPFLDWGRFFVLELEPRA